MDKLKITRKSLRTSFTKQASTIEAELREDVVDIEKINGILQLLNLKQEKLEEINQQIFEELADLPNVNQEDLDNEIEANDNYNLKYYILKEKVTKILRRCDDDEAASNVTRNTAKIENRVRYKLPQIELKKFSGELRDWLPFWSLFKKIDEDPLIDNSDKFQYLIQAITPGTRARDLVESYPATGENYDKVINSLKGRFGKEELLIEVYTRDLLGLVLQNITSSKDIILSTLYDKLECQLRALETLKITKDKCAAILLPLVESSLPEEILRVWQRSNFFKVNVDQEADAVRGEADCQFTAEIRLEQLMKFLRSELENEQKIKLALSGFGMETKYRKNINSNEDKKDRLHQHTSIMKGVSTATGLAVTNNNKETKCVFCDFNHFSKDCFKARKMTIEERKKILKEKRCCYNCLRIGHRIDTCRDKTLCLLCNRKHHILLCENLKTSNKNAAEAENKIKDVTENQTLACFSNPNRIMLQTLLIKIKIDNEVERIIRAIIDTGSQRSYILKSRAIEMGLPFIKEENVKHVLFGGIKTNVIKHKMFRVKLFNLKEDFNTEIEVLDQDVICGKIDSCIPDCCIKVLNRNNIELNDCCELPIEILIGADIAARLLTRNQCILTDDLTAVETKLGWTVMGKFDTNHENHNWNVTSLLVQDMDISDLWKLEVMGIVDPTEKKKKEDLHLEAEKHFLETVSNDIEGRFVVHLPWLSDHPPLPNNYNLSVKRLESTKKKLEKENLYEDYNNVFEDWLQEGIIEEVLEADCEQATHYLPHRPVVKLNSTTKIRPVFDASAKEKNGICFNSCVETGMNLIDLLPSIFIRFRLRKFGVISDIKKAFLQIGLIEQDRNLLRFLWFDMNDKLKVFRHCRLVFGLTCSPFLLGIVLKHHLENMKNTEYSSEVIKKLLSCFYVDNCVTSVSSEQELQLFITEATEILKIGKFELRGWEYTHKKNTEEENISNVLGLKWNRNNDCLKLNLDNFGPMTNDIVTKRIILSMMQRIFDPIGIFCPVLIFPKLLLQQIWRIKVGWDQPVDDVIKNQFLEWLRGLNYLGKIEIPRWLVNVENDVKYDLHIFCDASKDAYGAVIFLRSESYNKVNVELVIAKSRVATINKGKRITIPRLELLAAIIGVRLYSTVIKDLDIRIEEIIFWTDATTVLAWICRDDPWDVFVRNRVKEIKECTSPDQWRHIPGKDNPADLPSRGCKAKKLLESEWWKGPKWLYRPKETWPGENIKFDEEEINVEKRKLVVSNSMLACSDDKNSDWYYRYFSKYKQIVRLIAWVLKFKKHCFTKKEHRCLILTKEEIDTAEMKLIKLIQKSSFNGIKDEKLSSLCPFEDENGIIRVKSKIFYEEYGDDFCHPIVLPNHKHPVIKRLIFETHVECCHASNNTTLIILRKRFWILGGRRAVRSTISECIVCKRYIGKKIVVQSPPLPIDRIRKAKIFEVIGIDFAGPLFIKTHRKHNYIKVWVCLFTCAVYRAVHLELVSSLSTDRFLLCLRKFISRRGRPHTIYTDNGTNFVGAANALNRINWNKIEQHGKLNRIKWKFNPPAAPWWGGWWERLVGFLKQLLRRVLGRVLLDFEELQAVLTECEAVINARPITYISENPADLKPLSPDMFLREIEEIGVPDLDAVTIQDLNKRMKYRVQLVQSLKKRFQAEYLSMLMLQAQRNPSRDVILGELVFVENEKVKRNEWPLARVVELITGRDGIVRLVKLKTSTGMLLRPVQRLVPLELSNNQLPEEDASDLEWHGHEETRETEVDVQKEVIHSRCGRAVKPPLKLNL